MTIDTADLFTDLRGLADQLDLDLDGVELTESASLEDDLGMDSLSMMDFLIFLEKKYLVSIPNDRLRDVSTIGDVAQVINELADANEPVAAGA